MNASRFLTGCLLFAAFSSSVLLSVPSFGQTAGTCIESNIRRNACLEQSDPVAACTTALARDPADFSIRISLCDVLLADRDFARAHRILDEGELIADRRTRSLIEKARSYVAEAEVVEVDRTVGTLRYLVTRCLQFDDLKSCNGALKKAPSNVEVHQKKGDILLGEKRLLEAVFAYRAGLAVNPDQPSVHASLNEALAQRQSLSNQCLNASELRAVDVCTSALLAGEDDEARLREKIGDLLFGGGQLEQALGAYEDAKAIGGKVSRKIAAIGQVKACRAASGSRALTACEDAIDSAGNSGALRGVVAELHVKRGNALLSLERVAEAMAAFRRALALAPGRGDARLGLDRALLAQERFAIGCRDELGAAALADCRAARIPGGDDEFDIVLTMCRILDDGDDQDATKKVCAQAGALARTPEQRELVASVIAGPPDEPLPPPPPEPDPYDEQKERCFADRDGGDIDAALATCALALEMSPATDKAVLARIIAGLEYRKVAASCQVLIDDGEFEAALTMCQEAKTKAPRSDDAKAMRELIALATFQIARSACFNAKETGDLGAVSQQCRAAVQLAPDDVEREILLTAATDAEAILAQDRCGTLAMGNDPEAALEVCSEALEHAAKAEDRERLELLIAQVQQQLARNRCLALSDSGEIDDAITACEAAGVADVVLALTTKRDCLAWRSAADLDVALSRCESANESRPGDGEILAVIGEIRTEKNKKTYSNDPLESGVTDIVGVTH